MLPPLTRSARAKAATTFADEGLIMTHVLCPTFARFPPE